jgi:prepilin-type processing-associated H-X9-DG protein
MVAIGVLAVVLALILPLVGISGEEARRQRCMDNLRAIGLAVNHYISAVDALPPSGTRDDDPGGLQRQGIGPRQNAWSMKARILSYLDGAKGSPLVDSINFQLDPTWDHRGGPEPANATIRDARIAVFLCPSDPQTFASAPPSLISGAPSSYPNNVGNNRRFNGWVPDGPAYFPGWDRQVGLTLTLANISDGTNNTAIFSEAVLGDGLPPARSADGLGMVYVLPGFDPNANLGTGIQGEYMNAQNCQQNFRTREFTWKGERWALQDPGRGGFYSHSMPPNKRSCSYWGGGIGSDNFETMISASSYHPGGVNVLYMDGSVRFVTSTIQYQTWYTISTRDGGEVITIDRL